LNAKTVVALHELRSALPIPGQAAIRTSPSPTTRGRPLRDLRISVTDRCNFRCVYLHAARESSTPTMRSSARRAALLRGNRAARALFRAQGMEKVRLTGGEPLLRKDIERLVAMLREALPGVDLTLHDQRLGAQGHARALAAAASNASP
jgi:cyclic pyranopterin phosphate synthase